MLLPRIAYGTPRKLPKPSNLQGRVSVLDIAFAAGSRRISYEKITRPFIQALGERLAIWIDHHDHQMHEAYAHDRRFILRTKAEHAACPEMVTPERVAMAGPVDTVVCHTDFDGLCSAAKWLRGGIEAYAGADQDARVIDTRMGNPGERARNIDRALRARKSDNALKDLIVRFLADGAEESEAYATIRKAADELVPLEEEARRIASAFEVHNNVALVRIDKPERPFDKTELLMLGQQRALISLVADRTTVTVAARFDSGIDLLQILQLPGGMPTVVSLPAKYLDDVLSKLATVQGGR